MGLKVTGIILVLILLGSVSSYELGNYAFAATSNLKPITVKAKTDTSMANMGNMKGMNIKHITLPVSKAVKLANPSLPKGAPLTCPFTIIEPPNTLCHLDKAAGSQCFYHCHI